MPKIKACQRSRGTRKDGIGEARKRYKLEETPQTTGDVYVIRARGLGIKVGFTRYKVESRIRTLQTGCPVELELVGTFEGDQDAERALHCRLANYHLRGEWFSEEVLPLLERVIANPSLMAAR